MNKAIGGEGTRRGWPEAALATLAGVVFLACLGSVDIWGKREQRAAAEALDTVDHDHWLIARIQGRKRLEKPPLPRWTTAVLIRLTGRSDEWVVRLPAALSALGMVGLVYGLGRRLGGREVGLASGFVLTSSAFFISEVRQAGNDGPLAFFTALALYAAWRRLHGGPSGGVGATDPEPGPPPLGARGWSRLMSVAMGLGFLCKGPIVLVLVALTVVPYLALAGRLKAGLRALVDGWGLLLFLLLALSWPVPVLLKDPAAARVWYLEMAQKAGTGGLSHARRHAILAREWPGMTLPWSVVLASAAALPFLGRGKGLRPGVWFPWWWTFGNLAMFCLWEVAKPNYYLPCLPGAALLGGLEFVRLARSAREGRGVLDRALVQFHWVVLFTGALVAPAVISQWQPSYLPWASVAAVALAAGVVVSARAWHRGADAVSLAPLVAAMAVGVVVGYGKIAPRALGEQSHRRLAAAIDGLLPADARTVMFYPELDEGLWFYLRDRALCPVPGSQPEYNAGFVLYEEIRKGTFDYDPAARQARERQILIDWLRRPDRESSYVLLRGRTYDRFAKDLGGLAAPIYRERGLDRAELVLLRAPAPSGPVASAPSAPTRR